MFKFRSPANPENFMRFENTCVFCRRDTPYRFSFSILLYVLHLDTKENWNLLVGIVYGKVLRMVFLLAGYLLQPT